MSGPRTAVRTHSPRGVASFAIAVLWIPLLMLPMNPHYGEALPLILFFFWLWIACPFGILLGWRGLREPTHSRTYAGLGIVMNAVLFVALISRMFLR